MSGRRGSSSFGHRKPPSPSSSFFSYSSASSLTSGHLIPRSSSSSVSSHYPRSSTLGRSRSVPRPAPVGYASSEELIAESALRSGDSISVTIQFRPLSEREFQRGDEIAWYADGDKIAQSEYNPATTYAFGLDYCDLGTLHHHHSVQPDQHRHGFVLMDLSFVQEAF